LRTNRTRVHPRIWKFERVPSADGSRLSALVLRELERAIIADPRKLYDEGRLRPIHIYELGTGRGPQRRAIGWTTKVRFVDKLVAIDRAMKHLRLFDRDNRQMESNLTIQVGLVAAPPRKLIDSDEER
jgi:hypothetical protein